MIVEARFKQVNDEWTVQISFDGRGWSDLRLDEDFAEYLSNPRGGAFWMSNFNPGEQKTYSSDERIFLLKRRRPNITDLPEGGTSSSEPNGPAPGVALWIEKE